MMSIETELKKIGLEEREIDIYLALLTHGPGSVRKIAGITGINRGSAYDTIKSLRERGLISHYHEESKQCFVAEDPNKLKKIIDDRREELDQTAKGINAMIPELRSLFDKGGGKPVSRYYEGPTGIKTILTEILETMTAAEDKTYYVYSSASVREAGLYDAFPNYTDERIAHGIQVQTISLGPGGDPAELAERKWIPAVEGTPTYILIYSGKCAFISLGASANLFGVVIENDGLYQTQKLLFAQLWRTLDS